jgi:hypothetical protein
MYDFLLRFLPPKAAGAALVVWYVFLLGLILLGLEAPQVAFRYAEL